MEGGVASALAIPGVGPLIAAGPIMGALAGLGVGGTVGGLVGLSLEWAFRSMRPNATRGETRSIPGAPYRTDA
jgi:hypothetical protein